MILVEIVSTKLFYYRTVLNTIQHIGVQFPPFESYIVYMAYTPACDPHTHTQNIICLISSPYFVSCYSKRRTLLNT